MEKIRDYLKDPKIVGIVALVVGILIGWFVIGWGIWTVEWTDADLVDLRIDVQERVMKQVVNAYAQNGDAETAVASWSGFGEKAVDVFTSVKTSGEVPEENIEYFEQLLTAQEVTLPVVLVTETVLEGETPEETENQEEAVLPTVEPEKKKLSSMLGLLLGALLVIFLVGAAALAYFFFFKNNSSAQSGSRQRTASRSTTAPREPAVPTTVDEFDTFETETGMVFEDDGQYSSSPNSQHLRQFVTEYVYGNDLYDDTFSIDAATGEFLGECGVGISDTLGSGEPKNVTAFEVWLFDKNDVQTVTKVLMSEYAMNNPNILQRLEVKGEPVQIRPDTVVVLETATLKLEARVLDVAYGRGGQAEKSFVQQMQVEMTITSRESLG